MSSPIRVVIPIDSEEPESLGYAIAYAEKIAAQQTPPGREILLLTHTKDQLRHTSLARHLGDGASKALERNKEVGLSSGVTLRHVTRQTLSGWQSKGIVIVFYAEDRILEFVDGVKGLAGIVAVPEFEKSGQKWVERWNPAIHGQPRAATAPLIGDGVVEAALTTVSRMSNLPRDKEFAKEVLRILRAKGHQLDANQIKSWTIRNGWHPKAAQELADVAKKIGELKSKPSLSGIYNANERYERWKAESAGASPAA